MCICIHINYPNHGHGLFICITKYQNNIFGILFFYFLFIYLFIFYADKFFAMSSPDKLGI